MSLYVSLRINAMAGFPARDILRNMHKAKKKAIQRAEKYHLTKIPSFDAKSREENSDDEDGEDDEDYGRREMIYQIEDYIEYVKLVFRDRIAELELLEEPQTNKKKRKKKDRLYKNMMAIIRPYTMYYSAAALIVTRAIRQMGDNLKKKRGERWYDIRKKNAHMIEWDLRTWCRARNYTDGEEDEMIRDCPDIRNALNGILPEGRKDFYRIALWFHNRVHTIPQWWWDWWNMENGGLEVNPSISYRERLGLTHPAAGLKPWEY
jgi:hypothetical protein